MWVYKPEESVLQIPEQTAATSISFEETSALQAKPTPNLIPPAPKLSVRPPHSPHRATRDCIFLAAAYLLGAAVSGALQALCDAKQLAWLNFYLEAWRNLFQVGSAQTAAVLFGAEYAALAAAATILLLLGLSALGPVLIFLFSMLYGLGSGLLVTQGIAVAGWKGILFFLLLSGIPAALATGCLCVFGACALQVSGRIRAYSFFQNRTGQAVPNVRALLGQYCLVLTVLAPLCGAATGLAYLSDRF